MQTNQFKKNLVRQTARVVSVLLTLLKATTAAAACNPIEQSKLTASAPTTFDMFGYSVAVADDTALVGAYRDDAAGDDAGSVYVYVRSGTTWTQQVKLTASDAAASDFFGYSAAISGDTAVIGASGDYPGSAYVFVRSGTTWTQQAKLTASDPVASNAFGYSVAISNDTVVVGAHQDDHAGGVSAGSVYVFVRTGTTWTQQAKLTASDAAADDWFGVSVAVSGEIAVVGANGDDDAGSFSGSAYVFERTGTIWTQQAKLIAPDAAEEDHFGVSVAVSGETAVVGAIGDDDAGSFSGSAHVFARTGMTWAQQAKLVAAGALAFEYFGASVAISGEKAVVGAFHDHSVATNAGSASVFVRTGMVWTQQAVLTASDAAAGDQFGNSVAVSGDTAVVGPLANIGSAYVFALNCDHDDGIVASDRFSYTDSHLGNQNGGFGWTIPWYTAATPEGGWEVVSGEVVTEYRPYSSYAGRFFTNPASTSELFIRLDIRTPATVDINDTIAIFAGNITNWSLVFGKAEGTSDWGVGGGSFGITPTGVTITPNTTYHLIGVYDIDNHQVALWVNPDFSDYYNPTTGANSANATQVANPGLIAGLQLYAFNPDGTQKEGMGFDNIVIADGPVGVGLLAAPPPTPCTCRGDMNVDGVKNGLDIGRFVSCHINGGDCACADMDGLNAIDVNDVPLFVADLLNGQPCSDCNNPVRCQLADQWRFINPSVRVAEDFRIMGPGAIAQLCWSGIYGGFDGGDCGASAVDNYHVTYYEADGADHRPGTVRAGPYIQSAGTLSVSRALTGTIVGTAPEYQHHADHAPVAVSADECLWVEVINLGEGCGWNWESAPPGNGRFCVAETATPGTTYGSGSCLPFDLSLCIGPAPLELSPAGCAP